MAPRLFSFMNITDQIKEQSLYTVPALVNHLSPVSCSVLWEPMGDGKRVISLAENHVLLSDLQESSSKATVRFIIL